MNPVKKILSIIPIGLLIVFACAIWIAVLQQTPSKILTVAFLNIGQGDSIFIESPTHEQLLIDGGPNQRVLSEISKRMPWYDRSIDMLMVSNPDKDHYAGFIDILNRYSIGEIVEPGTISPTDTYTTFEQSITNHQVEKIIAKRGMKIHLGGGAIMDILFPDRDASTLKTNDGSIIAKLTYGSTTIMFTGDAPSATEEYVATLNKKEVDSDILKVGHHGSRTSASETFIRDVSPEYAIISAGENNSYGHPHKETIDLLHKLKIPTLITFKEGTIVLKTDGITYSLTH